MITIYPTVYIYDSDIFDTFGTHYSDYNFFECCENDSYISIYCNDEALKELYDEKEQCEFENIPENEDYLKNIYNEIQLVEHLRNKGCKDEVLISVCW